MLDAYIENPNLILKISLCFFLLEFIIFFICGVRMRKKITLGLIETVIVPITVLAILITQLKFIFANNIILTVTGLVLIIIGATVGMLSLHDIGSNIDDFWFARKKLKNRYLVTSGPYAYIRHPLYTSLLVQYLGITLTFFHPVTVLVYLSAVVIIAYTAIAEERFLQGIFPEYQNYMKRTGRFFPKLKT